MPADGISVCHKVRSFKNTRQRRLPGIPLPSPCERKSAFAEDFFAEDLHDLLSVFAGPVVGKL